MTTKKTPTTIYRIWSQLSHSHQSYFSKLHSASRGTTIMYKRFEYNHRNYIRKKTRIHAYKKRSGKAHFQMLFWESPFPAAMFPRNWRLQRRAEKKPPENILTGIERNTNKFHINDKLQRDSYTLQNPSKLRFGCSISLLLYIDICIFSCNANSFTKYSRIMPKTNQFFSSVRLIGILNTGH